MRGTTCPRSFSPSRFARTTPTSRCGSRTGSSRWGGSCARSARTRRGRLLPPTLALGRRVLGVRGVRADACPRAEAPHPRGGRSTASAPRGGRARRRRVGVSADDGRARRAAPNEDAWRLRPSARSPTSPGFNIGLHRESISTSSRSASRSQRYERSPATTRTFASSAASRDPSSTSRATRRRRDTRSAFRPDGKIVLVSGGGWGVGDLADAAEAALRHDDVSSVVCLCGRNDDVRERLARRFAAEPRVRVEGFTEAMNDWLAAADVLIHSTGGLTVLEAHMRGCPTISFGWGRGHVRRHNDAFVEFGLAEVVSAAADLPDALSRAFAVRKNADLSYAEIAFGGRARGGSRPPGRRLRAPVGRPRCRGRRRESTPAPDDAGTRARVRAPGRRVRRRAGRRRGSPAAER